MKQPIVGYGLNLQNYETKLLSLALSSGDFRAQVNDHTEALPRGREFELLAKGQDIDVVWGSATKQRFLHYRPVQIPIYKGLIGWRLALIHQNTPTLFAPVKKLEQLRHFLPGQHRNWTDYKIYRLNGFDVASGLHSEALANMLHKQRFDFFPRAVIEVEKELQEYQHLNITLDQHLLIRYPSAYVFYVAKENPLLANAIEKGLNKALENGSFDALFKSHFEGLFKSLLLQKRQLIELNNPLLPDSMRELESKYWVNPKAFPL